MINISGNYFHLLSLFWATTQKKLYSLFNYNDCDLWELYENYRVCILGQSI